jgi:hypothetical protein
MMGVRVEETSSTETIGEVMMRDVDALSGKGEVRADTRKSMDFRSRVLSLMSRKRRDLACITWHLVRLAAKESRC